MNKTLYLKVRISWMRNDFEEFYLDIDENTQNKIRYSDEEKLLFCERINFKYFEDFSPTIFKTHHFTTILISDISRARIKIEVVDRVPSVGF